MLEGLVVDEEKARKKLYHSGAVTTALSPLIGYHKAAELARTMKENNSDVFEANSKTEMLDPGLLQKLMKPDRLLKKGFTMNDIREML